jgi:hypothetical protein
MPGGQLVTFSYKACLSPAQAQRAWIMSALREEIAEQIAEFRSRAVPVCELTGTALVWERGYSNSMEVDHAPPATFASLVKAWLVHENLNGLDAIPVVNVGQRPMISDPALSESWRRFHSGNARLRLLAAGTHLEVTKGHA